MHLSTIDWARFASKIRWYQAWEFLQGRWDRRMIELYRWYHRDFHTPEEKSSPLQPVWTEGLPVDILDVPTQPYYRWDEEMIRLFHEHGTERFRKLALWDVDWNSLLEKISETGAARSIDDPRSPLDRWIHSWLEKTQPYHSHFPLRRKRLKRLSDWLLSKLFSIAGW